MPTAGRSPRNRGRANGLPGLGVYAATTDAEQLAAYGVMVLRIEDGAVVEITGFGDGDLRRFFGMPATLAA